MQKTVSRGRIKFGDEPGLRERILEGEEISNKILNDEVKYTIEVLLPLFRNMDFIDVKYNHGKREFGKDVTFSEMDKFGERRNYGVQVKAGSLSGEAGSEIDKIIEKTKRRNLHFWNIDKVQELLALHMKKTIR